MKPACRSQKTPRALAAGACAAVLLGLLAAGGVARSTEQSPAHGTHAQDTVALTPNPGRAWPTDAFLRQGMGQMRTAMADALPAIYAGQYPAPRYAVLAKRLDGQVAFIVTNCRLEPAADAQLHRVLAQVSAGSEAMQRGGDARQREAGALRVVQALNAYGEHFNHPDWQALSHH